MVGFNKYVGVQGILALLVTVALLVFVAIQIAIPEQIWTLLGLSWGFYFARNGKQIVAERKGNV